MTINPGDPTAHFWTPWALSYTHTNTDTHTSVNITEKGVKRLPKPEEVVNILREIVFDGAGTGHMTKKPVSEFHPALFTVLFQHCREFTRKKKQLILWLATEGTVCAL